MLDAILLYSLLVYSALAALVALAATTAFSIADRRYFRLRDARLPDAEYTWPKVSIIVAGRNEERDIQASIESLLRLSYANFELMVVNDRSTDRTGEILDRLAKENPRVRVVHLEELPEGWIGKNHALQYGADHSDGEWILFTDADIVFEPTALSRAICWAQSEGLDHLAVTPETEVPGFLLNSFVATFVIFFNAYFQPWRARDPHSRHYIGIGAFNLVRRSAYQKVDGHAPIRMRPDDDVKLGKILKSAGFTQDVAIGVEMISVPWYASINELIIGLEKNAFAGVEYNPLTIVLSSLGALLLNVGPFVGVALCSGWPRILFALACGLWLYCSWHSCRNLKQSTWYCFGFPFTVVLLVYIQWRSMLLNYWRDGISWRDTHYSLAELRANRV